MNKCRSCPKCKYSDTIIDAYPCNKCCNANNVFKDSMWEPKETNQEITEQGGKQSKIEWSIHEYISLALPRIAAIAAKGFANYGPDNWYKVSARDDMEHAVRHSVLALNESQGIKPPDGEEGEDHLAHAACRIMMAMAMEERKGI